jgi:CPA2 family monovalent cation:H+ antiporter-2
VDLIADLTLVLVAALAGGFLAQRAGQPLIVGYMLAGVVVGPFTGGFTVAHVHDLDQLAEIGVALLLFSLGLEVSFRQLAPVRAVALGGAVIQIVLTMALGFGIARALGWAAQAAVWFGALIALSSTMVALKTLQAQGRLGTLSSRVMLGILVVQDLAVVPLMIVLPELGTGASIMRVVLASLRAFALLAVIVVVATRLVPRLMAVVARWNSRELFLLTTTAVALGVGMATWWFGLSLAIGAFVAGLVINESDYAHQALSDVAPLRDLFGMLFFVSVGMLLDPAVAWRHAGAVAGVVAAVFVGKAAILAGVVRIFGYGRVVPLAVGLTLFQVGEFAFVLARAGVSSGAVAGDLYTLMLNAAVATMALTPVVSGATPWIYSRFARRTSREPLEAVNIPGSGLAQHIVIAGAGRVGRTVGDALARLKLPFVLIDIDHRQIDAARAAGMPVIYGDATQPVVLEAAGLADARALLVTVPALADVRAIVATAQHLRADLAIAARADSPDAMSELYALGIEEVASPELEAAIEMTRQAMTHLDVPTHDVLQIAAAIRRRRAGADEAAGQSARALMTEIGEVARQLEFGWMGVGSGSAFDGRALRELQMRTRFGVSVVGVIRDGVLTANPDGEVRLAAGDLIAVLGTADQIAGIRTFSASYGD